jgi:hypothetical protein
MKLTLTNFNGFICRQMGHLKEKIPTRNPQNGSVKTLESATAYLENLLF